MATSRGPSKKNLITALLAALAALVGTGAWADRAVLDDYGWLATEVAARVQARYPQAVGRVAAVEQGVWTVDVGLENGVSVGDRLDVYGPASGDECGPVDDYWVLAGRLRVTGVDPFSSRAEPVGPAPRAEAGFVVRSAPRRVLVCTDIPILDSTPDLMANLLVDALSVRGRLQPLAVTSCRGDWERMIQAGGAALVLGQALNHPGYDIYAGVMGRAEPSSARVAVFDLGRGSLVTAFDLVFRRSAPIVSISPVIVAEPEPILPEPILPEPAAAAAPPPFERWLHKTVPGRVLDLDVSHIGLDPDGTPIPGLWILQKDHLRAMQWSQGNLELVHELAFDRHAPERNLMGKLVGFDLDGDGLMTPITFINHHRRGTAWRWDETEGWQAHEVADAAPVGRDERSSMLIQSVFTAAISTLAGDAVRGLYRVDGELRSAPIKIGTDFHSLVRGAFTDPAVTETAVIDRDGAVRVYNRDGELAAVSKPGYGIALEAADINNNGLSELLVTLAADGGETVVVLEYADGKLRQLWRSRRYPGVIFALKVADLDADGYREVVVPLLSHEQGVETTSFLLLNLEDRY